MSENKCKINYCTKNRGNYCCFHCLEVGCKNRCLNSPDKCNLTCEKETKRGEYTPIFNEEKAERLYWSGLSDSQIANTLKVRKENVQYWRKKRGFRSNREERIRRAKAKAVELYKRGLTVAEVNEHVDFERHTIIRWLKQEGLYDSFSR